MHTVIAIDGPAGAGKSTVAKIISQKLSYCYIDSGALFRAITLKAIKKAVDMKDIDSIVNIAKNVEIDFYDEKTFLDGKDVSTDIRDNAVNLNVSYIAKIGKVRSIVEDLQRKIAIGKNVVVDGRDIGTTIFPNAQVKFFLIASVEERARRRLLELNSHKNLYNLDDIIDQISKRDEIDSNRDISPLKKADDAITIETDGKSIEEVVSEMLDKIEDYMENSK